VPFFCFFRALFAAYFEEMRRKNSLQNQKHTATHEGGKTAVFRGFLHFFSSISGYFQVVSRSVCSLLQTKRNALKKIF